MTALTLLQPWSFGSMMIVSLAFFFCFFSALDVVINPDLAMRLVPRQSDRHDPSNAGGSVIFIWQTPVDGSPFFLYILVACSMFDYVFPLIHTFKNSVGDGAGWREMQIWVMFLLVHFLFLFLNYD
jgi:hypothetical protein